MSGHVPHCRPQSNEGGLLNINSGQHKISKTNTLKLTKGRVNDNICNNIGYANYKEPGKRLTYWIQQLRRHRRQDLLQPFQRNVVSSEQ